MRRSARCRAIAPKIIPRTETHTPPEPIAGIKRLKKVAASITPAENPSIISKNLSETFFMNKIGRAPMPVAKRKGYTSTFSDFVKLFFSNK